MSARDDGGPAFPQLQTTWDDEKRQYVMDMSLDGMSLRDYFAAKAMQGFAADPALCDANPSRIATAAYVWADAMLKVRQA